MLAPTIPELMVGGWELVLPPPALRVRKWLSLNDRNHWSRSSPLTKYWRTIAKREAQELNLDHVLSQAYVQALMTFGDNRRRDVHNYMPTVKAAIDGCTDAGLWLDDRDGTLTGPDMRRFEPGGKHNIGLRLLIWEVAADV